MRSLPLLLALSLAACDAQPPSAEDDPPGGKADEGTSGQRMPNEIHWQRNSAEYQAAARQAYRLAAQVLDARPATEDPWAVVMDADETIIDNSTYQKERAAQGLGYSAESWREWVARKAAPAVPGAKAFIEHVHDLGGLVFVVSNRASAECDDTKANFRMVGLKPDLVLCKTDDSEKEPRFAMIEAGTASAELPAAPIVLFVGDNITDFPDLDQDVRQAGDDGFTQFGARFIVIPNPMYGSWERNARD